jgi:hypothetical protein
MLELFERARWDQAYDYLASGDPPMIARLLAINTIFLILYVVRKVRVTHSMRESTMYQVQGLLLLANFLILFQSDVQNIIDRLIRAI